MPQIILRIDYGDLEMALQNHYGEIEYFLDTVTGRVIMVSQYTDDNEEEEVDGDADVENRIPIPPIPSYKSYQFMVDFTETVTDIYTQDHLRGALDAKKPFRAFKTALYDYPKERERWFAFEREKLISAAREWLTGAGIQAELMNSFHPKKLSG